MAEAPSLRPVLVVDDQKDFALSLSILIHHRGYEVMVAHDGRNALEMVERFRPEVVFMDLSMPGMDGYTVARQLRDRPGGGQLCLVAITGHGEILKSAAEETLFDHRFLKPVDPEVLLAVIPRPA